MIKKQRFYEIRYYPSSNAYSKGIGRHLISNAKKANAIVKRLRKMRIDAFKIPFHVNVQI